MLVKCLNCSLEMNSSEHPDTLRCNNTSQSLRGMLRRKCFKATGVKTKGKCKFKTIHGVI